MYTQLASIFFKFNSSGVEKHKNILLLLPQRPFTVSSTDLWVNQYTMWGCAEQAGAEYIYM